MTQESPPRPTALVVDDLRVVRRVCAMLLEVLGYDVLQAATAEEALEVLDEASPGVTVLLADLDLRGPTPDGAALIREALARHPQLRAVQMSGYTREDLADLGVPLCDVPLLTKPVGLDQLRETLARLRT